MQKVWDRVCHRQPLPVEKTQKNIRKTSENRAVITIMIIITIMIMIIMIMIIITIMIMIIMIMIIIVVL